MTFGSSEKVKRFGWPQGGGESSSAAFGGQNFRKTYKKTKFSLFFSLGERGEYKIFFVTRGEHFF